VSPFIVLPLVAGILWLGHAGLTIAGSRAHRHTRWFLLGGLPVLTAAMLLNGGMVGFLLALITTLTWLGMILAEVLLAVALMFARDARLKQAG
jgi:hypothetical protein